MTEKAAPISTGTSVSLLRDRTFARLWFTQAATQVGGNMALYALTWLVFTSTRSRTISPGGSVSDASSDVSGYSVIKADSLDAAVELAKGCPVLLGDSRVEVAKTFEAM